MIWWNHGRPNRSCDEDRTVTPEALRHLSRTDPVMGALIRRTGPCTIRIQKRWSPFQSLVRAVVYQQLHGRAAAAIFGRLVALFGGPAFPTPEAVLAMSTRRMRGAGLSRAKVRAIKDIARKTAAGVVPARRIVSRLGDDEIVERLTAARGVGRWTVEMLLIFTLGRQDVLPADDYGVRDGYRAAYSLKVLPTPKALLAYGERWRPHRSTAAWYLWRAAEHAKQKKSKQSRKSKKTST
jgi:DNA-3-methyladenine glycosylase II